MKHMILFQYMFGDNVRSLANSKKTFTCLMKVLTDLVPYDDHSYLKVHILRPPFVPPKCKELLTEYIILAKTRLVDLKVQLVLLYIMNTKHVCDEWDWNNCMFSILLSYNKCANSLFLDYFKILSEIKSCNW
jgi:hypothetical protein